MQTAKIDCRKIVLYQIRDNLHVLDARDNSIALPRLDPFRHRLAEVALVKIDGPVSVRAGVGGNARQHTATVGTRRFDQ
jgi:hypothetical protein